MDLRDTGKRMVISQCIHVTPELDHITLKILLKTLLSIFHPQAIRLFSLYLTRTKREQLKTVKK